MKTSRTYEVRERKTFLGFACRGIDWSMPSGCSWWFSRYNRNDLVKLSMPGGGDCRSWGTAVHWSGVFIKKRRAGGYGLKFYSGRAIGIWQLVASWVSKDRKEIGWKRQLIWENETRRRCLWIRLETKYRLLTNVRRGRVLLNTKILSGGK